MIESKKSGFTGLYNKKVKFLDNILPRIDRPESQNQDGERLPRHSVPRNDNRGWLKKLLRNLNFYLIKSMQWKFKFVLDILPYFVPFTRFFWRGRSPALPFVCTIGWYGITTRNDRRGAEARIEHSIVNNQLPMINFQNLFKRRTSNNE